MKISIIIPAHNEERNIGATIKSCLNQTVKPHEIIVVNDGSTDRTQDIVEMMRLRNPELKLINFGEGHSAAFARNNGAKVATGEVLIFLDADMMPIENDFISKTDMAFSDSEVKAAYFASCGEYKTFIQRCQRVRVELTKFCLKQTGKRRFSVNAVRADFFRELGGYDEKVFYYEDAELTERVQARTEIRLINTMVCHDEPRTFGEFMHQSKFVGRGIGTSSSMLKSPAVLLFPHYPLFWLLFLLSLLLLPVTPLLLEILSAFLFTEVGLAIAITGDILPSIFYVMFLSPVRTFLISIAFINTRMGENFGLSVSILVVLLILMTILMPYGVDYLCEHQVLTDTEINCQVCIPKYTGLADNSTWFGCRNWNMYYGGENE